MILSGGLYESYSSTAVRAEKFADNGIAGAVFDFTGTADGSQSDGERQDLTVLTEAADLNAVFDGVSSLPEINSDNIFLWGHSVGGLVSTYVAEQRPDDVKGLIVLEPSYQMQDQCKAQFPEGSEIPDNEDKSFTEDLLSLDIYEKMAEYKRNVILFSGTTSQSIGGTTPEYFKRAAETFPSMKEEVIEGADHRFKNLSDDASAQMMDKMINFINENKD